MLKEETLSRPLMNCWPFSWVLMKEETLGPLEPLETLEVSWEPLKTFQTLWPLKILMTTKTMSMPLLRLASSVRTETFWRK